MSGILKILPIDSQLSNRSTNSSELHVAPAPVGNDRNLLIRWIAPFPVRATAFSWQFLTTKCGQLSRNFAIRHGAVTTVSNHTGLLASQICAFCGRVRPRS